MTTSGTSDVRIEKDVVLGQAGDRDLSGDLFWPPPGLSKRTAVVHLYGGQGGNRIQASDAAQRFAERGYLGITCWYRVGAEAKFPAQVHDIKAAIRWTRANAGRLGIEPEKVVLGGYSLGAITGMVAAGTADRPEWEGEGGNAGVSTRVAAFVAYYPPRILRRRADGGDHSIMAPGSSEDAYRAASPETYLGRGFPPTLFAQSTIDELVPYEDSLRMFQQLKAAGVPAELHVFDGLSHVFDRHPEFGDVLAQLVDLFLDRHVADPRAYPPFVPSSRR